MAFAARIADLSLSYGQFDKIFDPRDIFCSNTKLSAPHIRTPNTAHPSAACVQKRLDPPYRFKLARQGASQLNGWLANGFFCYNFFLRITRIVGPTYARIRNMTATYQPPRALQLVAKGIFVISFLVGIFILVYGFSIIEIVADSGKIIMGAAGAFSAFIGVAYFLWPAYRLNFALLIFSLGTGAYLFNFILEIRESSDQKQAYREVGVARNKRSAKKRFDRRNKIEVINDFKRQNIDAYPSGVASQLFNNLDNDYLNSGIHPFGNIFPIGGISNIKTVLCNETGDWAIYQSDRHGFNNDDTVYSRPGPRLMILGDSFAHGSCVPEGKDIGGRLRAHGYNAINIAVRGNGPLLELAGLVEYGRILKPKIVFWVYYEGNDLRNLKEELGSQYLKNYLSKKFYQGLTKRQDEIDSFWKRFINIKKELIEINASKDSPKKTAQIDSRKKIDEIARRFSFRKFSRGGGDTPRQYDTPTKQTSEKKEKYDFRSTVTNIRNFIVLSKLRTLLGSTGIRLKKNQNRVLLEKLRTIFKRAKEETAAWGGKIHVVYLPVQVLGSRYFSIKSEERVDRTEIIKILRELNIPLTNFERALEEKKYDPKFFPSRGHYTTAGYQLLADYIVREALSKEAGVKSGG